MEVNEQIIINKLDYQLNPAALNANFDFLSVKLASETQQIPFQQALQKSKVLVLNESKLKKILMFKRGDAASFHEVPGAKQELVRAGGTGLYRNQILQLMLNYLPMMADLGPLDEKNDRSQASLISNLIVAMPDLNWSYVSVGGTAVHLYVAAKLEVTWEGNLKLSTQTFTDKAAEVAKQDSVRYFFDQNHGIIRRDYQRFRSPGLVKRNPTSRNNQIDFVNAENFTKFNQSKVAIAYEYLNKLNEYFGAYFMTEKSPKLMAKTVTDFAAFKITKKSEINPIWDHFRGATINLYGEIGDEKTLSLVQRFQQLADDSPVLKQLGIAMMGAAPCQVDS